MMAAAWRINDHSARDRLKDLVTAGKLICHKARNENGNIITAYRKAG